jgi:hypothetical protein
MPLSWLAGYTTSASIPVWVVGLDAAGNRGPGTSALLTLDRTTLTATAAQGGANDATLTVTANVGGGSSSVGRVEAFLGAVGAFGSGTAIPLSSQGIGSTTFNLNTAAYASGGPVTVTVRAQRATGPLAGQWITTTRTVTLRPVILLATGFDVGNPAFNGTTSVPAGGLTFTTVGPIAGGRSLQAAASGTATRFVTQNITTNPAASDRFFAKFLMRAGTNASTAVVTGSTPITVFTVGSNAASGTTRDAIQVRYARATSTGAVRFQVGVTNGAGVLVWSSAQFAAAPTYSISLDVNRGTGVTTLKVRPSNVVTTTSIVNNTAPIGFVTSRARLGVVIGTAGATGNLLFDTYSSARAPH